MAERDAPVNNVATMRLGWHVSASNSDGSTLACRADGQTAEIWACSSFNFYGTF
jgi:hypothetical protein